MLSLESALGAYSQQTYQSFLIPVVVFKCTSGLVLIRAKEEAKKKKKVQSGFI